MLSDRSSSFKRALLECLKFLSVAEILRTSSTSRFWHFLCAADELWLFLLGEEGNRYRLSLLPVPSLQQTYRWMQKFVYVIRGDYLLRYAASTGKWVSKPLSKCSPMNIEITLTRASETKLFACGGTAPTLDAFFVDVITGVMTIARNMRVHRPYPGVCRYDQHIYCFAGDIANRRRDCDRIDIDTGEWERLPDCIAVRHAFNPVVVRPVIYLPNGCCSTVEVFDVASSTFTMLPIDTRQLNSSGNLYYNGELVILGLEKALLWKPGDPVGRSAKYSEKLHTAWSSYDPVVHAGEVVLVWSHDNLWKICFVNLSTFQSRVIDIP